jgi:hypothetical protein
MDPTRPSRHPLKKVTPNWRLRMLGVLGLIALAVMLSWSAWYYRDRATRVRSFDVPIPHLR